MAKLVVIRNNRKGFIMRGIVILIGFIFLDTYFNLLPKIFPILNGPFWIIFALSVFLLLHVTMKLYKFEGLESIGYVIYKGWLKHYLLGFTIGGLSWAIMYVMNFSLNKYQFHVINNFAELPMIFISAVVLSFFGSTLNDAIIRGYWYANLKGRVSPTIIILFTSILYTLDDAWNEGFSWNNSLFSFLLGLSLATSFIRSKSIWSNTGIHMGINFTVYMLFGVPGSSGIFTITDTRTDPIFVLIPIAITILLFAVVYILNRPKEKSSNGVMDTLISKF